MRKVMDGVKPRKRGSLEGYSARLQLLLNVRSVISACDD
jgi:hypothetical protein